MRKFGDKYEPIEDPSKFLTSYATFTGDEGLYKTARAIEAALNGLGNAA